VKRFPRPGRLAALAVLLWPAMLAAQSWTPVPPADFASIQLSQFADHELDVPYHLKHFAQVANAVIENTTAINGVTYPRGFLNIKVNREPVDNVPHNARILEMQMVLAYFYTADRPWNPYRGNASVRQRLEAMMNLWTTMQAPEGSSHAGLFTEYSPTNWSMAPTSFGVMAAAQAVDMIHASGLPFDATVLGNTKTTIRRALMALFTRSDMRSHARSWSNQFNGAYHAALIYLERWPDAELDAAFVQAVKDSSAQDQSPAGFWYEQDGPDFGYSGVHDNNLRVAWPRLRQRADLVSHIIGDDIQWNGWLAANMVLQPGLSTNTFFTSAGLNTRTSHAFQTPRSRPLAEFATSSRAFALTDTEFAAAVAAKRNSEQSRFGNYGNLSVPNGYSYIPTFVYDAARPASSILNGWHPTSAQREAAIAALPSRTTNTFNRLYHNATPNAGAFSLGAVKRGNYYATFASGNRRLARQAYGLNLLWNPSFGLALQAVSGNSGSIPWQWGTVRGTDAGLAYETGNMPGTIKAGADTVSPVAGVTDLPAGDYAVSYALAGGGTTYGQKSITFGGSSVSVVVTHTNTFTEHLPLAHASDATLSGSPTRLVLQRPNGSSFLLQLNTPASIDAGNASSLTGGMVRRGVTIRATNALSYTLTVSDSAPPPETTTPAISIADLTVAQPPSGGTDAMVTVSLSVAPSSNVTVNYATEDGTALAGTDYTATGGTLTFGSGETSKTITVPVASGSLPLGSSKNFGVKLTNPANATISRGTASVTINGSTAAPPPPAGSVRMEFVPGNAWTGTYQGTLRIINNSSADITDWEAEFDFNGSNITFFNNTVTRTGDRVILKPVSWQRNVPAGTTFDNLGFQAQPGTEEFYPRNLELRVVAATGVDALAVLTGPDLGTFTTGSPLSINLAAGGGIGPYLWNVAPGSALPAGLALSSDGQLRGMLTATESGTFEVEVSDAMDKSATRSFSVNVVLPLTIETSSFGPATAGTFFASMLEGRGGTGPYSWSLLAGSLPDGLSLGSDGLLTGYPGSPGESFFELRLVDGANHEVTRGFDFLVAPAPDPFAEWTDTVRWDGADSSPDADPDGDGMPNFAEYALGTDPLSATDRPSVLILPPAGSEHLSITFRRAADPGLLYEVLASDDLVGWDPVWSSTGAENTAGPVTVRDPEASPGQPKRFMRLQIAR
jgi:hypothetical protein